MDGFVLDEKSFFKRLELSLSTTLDWGSYIVLIAETASKNNTALIPSTKFFSSEVALYFYKFTQTAMHGILLLCLDWCFQLLIVYDEEK